MMEYRSLIAAVVVVVVVELLGYSTVKSTALVQVASHEPMVAFSCGLPAMHMTDNGWKKDDSTDCVLEPQAILMYCRKTYSTLDIRNVVEASSTIRIEDWCPFGRTRCHHRAYTVRPYRCLVGAFQSDALLVPRSCLFDHIHDPRACLTYDAWNYSADAACMKRGLVLHSFAIIQPCNVDRFNGAEFVCCPADLHSAEEKSAEEDIQKASDPIKTSPPVAPPTPELVTPIPIETELQREDDAGGEASADDAYTNYVQKGTDINKTEHELYRLARAELEKHHHLKVTKMMKEWTVARQRVQEMRTFDEKGAEKLNRQITAVRNIRYL